MSGEVSSRRRCTKLSSLVELLAFHGKEARAKSGAQQPNTTDHHPLTTLLHIASLGPDSIFWTSVLRYFNISSRLLGPTHPCEAFYETTLIFGFFVIKIDSDMIFARNPVTDHKSQHPHTYRNIS